jgi:hypothetical protein
MTGETQREPSGWTPDTLKVLEDEKIQSLERLFKAEIRRLDEALAAQDRAVVLLNTANQIAQDKFEATVERDSVKQNEFRGSLDDLSKLMATRRETETAFASMGQRVDDQAKQIGDLRSRLDVGPAGLASIQAQQNQQTGRREGVQTVATNAYYAFAIFAALAGGLIGHFLK